MFDFISNLAATRPILTMLLYIVFCALAGIGIFFGYSAIRKKIEIKKNMKRRVANDQSN